jgi:hypothetical protein
MNPGDKSEVDRIFDRYRVALCGSTLLMVGLAWPLWVDGGDFPRVPFLKGLAVLPAWVAWLQLIGLLATLTAAMFNLAAQAMIRLSVAFLIFSILQDQNRFQPWAYQYAMIGLVIGFATRPEVLRLARWSIIGLYFYSGLSKLDASFCREMGPTFLSAAVGPFGASPSTWPVPAQVAACLAMPVFEIAVATLLLFRATRRVGLVGAIAQHSALLWILGPWNLGHSLIVLLWNLALIVQDVILFGPTAPLQERRSQSLAGRAVGWIFWSAMILPIGERFGFCDAWPGFALYASHVERAEVYLHEEDLDQFPDAIRARIGPSDATPWRRLDLTGWSRDVRGTPLYPSGRVGNAVAEFLEVRSGGVHPVRLVQWSRAGVWDGRRSREEIIGLRAIHLRGNRFWLNAHPVQVEHH